MKEWGGGALLAEEDTQGVRDWAEAKIAVEHEHAVPREQARHEERNDVVGNRREGGLACCSLAMGVVAQAESQPAESGTPHTHDVVHR